MEAFYVYYESFFFCLIFKNFVKMEKLKEQPAEAESEEKPAETPAPADNGVSEADEMEKKKLERFVL